MNCILFVYSFPGRALGWLYTLSFANNASVNMDVCVSVGCVDLGCSRYTGILHLDDCVFLFLVLLGNSILFSKVVIPVYDPIKCHTVLSQKINKFKHSWEDEERSYQKIFIFVLILNAPPTDSLGTMFQCLLLGEALGLWLSGEWTSFLVMWTDANNVWKNPEHICSFHSSNRKDGPQTLCTYSE